MKTSSRDAMGAARSLLALMRDNMILRATVGDVSLELHPAAFASRQVEHHEIHPAPEDERKRRERFIYGSSV